MSQKTIEGRIGRYVNNTIHGWCAIQGESDSIRIECLVDGISLGELIANDPRKNLIKKNRSSINHGFAVKIKSEDKIRKIEIIESLTNRQIPGSPTIFDGTSGQPLVFFMHIPKTAGTSLRHMFDLCFMDEQVFPNITDIKNNGGLYPDINSIYSLNKDRLSGLKLVNGHYPLSLADRWLSDMKIVTCFRRPKDRVISHLRHLKKNDKTCKSLSFDEIYDKHKQTLINLQLRILRNKEYPNAHLIDFNAKKFNEEKLIATLDRFAAFGIVEDFEQTSNWISRSLGLNFEKQVFTNKSSHELSLSDQLLEQIEKHTELEDAAYNIIKSEFYRRSVTPNN